MFSDISHLYSLKLHAFSDETPVCNGERICVHSQVFELHIAAVNFVYREN